VARWLGWVHKVASQPSFSVSPSVFRIGRARAILKLRQVVHGIIIQSLVASLGFQGFNPYCRSTSRHCHAHRCRRLMVHSKLPSGCSMLVEDKSPASALLCWHHPGGYARVVGHIAGHVRSIHAQTITDGTPKRIGRTQQEKLIGAPADSHRRGRACDPMTTEPPRRSPCHRHCWPPTDSRRHRCGRIADSQLRRRAATEFDAIRHHHAILEPVIYIGVAAVYASAELRQNCCWGQRARSVGLR